MKKTVIFHPFIFAAFPIINMAACNIGEVSVFAVIISLVASISFAALLFLFANFIAKEAKKAGVISSFFFLLFFFYGHFFALLIKNGIWPDFLRNRFKLIAFLFVLVLGIYWIVKKSKYLNEVTKILNMTALFLLVISCCSFFYKLSLAGNFVPKKVAAESAGSEKPDFGKAAAFPDIYYIILDGYGSARTLRDLFNFDNKEFIDYLEKKGFFVTTQSRSNYGMTLLSLSSSLSMDYLRAESPPPKDDELGQDVYRFLKRKGYKYVGIGGDAKRDFLRDYEFYIILLRTTPIDILANRLNLYAPVLRDRILRQFDALAAIPETKGPRFIFVHILAPHPPYVFDRNGKEVSRIRMDAHLNIFKSGWDDKEAYLDQLIFINKKVMSAVREILSKSAVAPIIILQADHGPVFSFEGDRLYKVRMNIFNAYYLPGSDHAQGIIYNSVTPVNSFRLIFNHYFQAGYPILPDKSYFSSFENPYHFIDVTDQSRYK